MVCLIKGQGRVLGVPGGHRQMTPDLYQASLRAVQGEKRPLTCNRLQSNILTNRVNDIRNGANLLRRHGLQYWM
jgi:hypothetical protein